MKRKITIHRFFFPCILYSLKSMFIDPSGRLVNYIQLRTNHIYNDLCEITKHLTTISLDNVTENERKTFFISNYLN